MRRSGADVAVVSAPRTDHREHVVRLVAADRRGVGGNDAPDLGDHRLEDI
jgi:hypothetical protein